MGNDLGLGSAARAILASSSIAPTHFSFPPNSQPRLLAPRYPARAAAASVRRYTTPEVTRVRIGLAAAAIAARSGIARIAPATVAVGGPGTFIAHAQEVLGDASLVVAVHLGPPRANRKPVMHFMSRTGESVAYAKLGINEFTNARIRNEADALCSLGAAHTPSLVSPEPIAAGGWEGLEYLIMGPLASHSNRVPGSVDRQKANGALVAAFPMWSEELANSGWWSRIINDLELCYPSPEKERLQKASHEIAKRYGSEQMKVGAAHGDWSRWNMSVRDSELVVWDWERFATDVPVGWDELHFLLGIHPGGPAAAVAEAYGSSTGSPGKERLLCTYLLQRGVSRLEGWGETGVSSAALRTWLLPALEQLLARTEAKAAD